MLVVVLAGIDQLAGEHVVERVHHDDEVTGSLIVARWMRTAPEIRPARSMVWIRARSSCQRRAMTIPKRGSRQIVVDGIAFRWRVRARPTYAQANAWSPLTVAVEGEGTGVLVLVFDGARPDNWMHASASVATPSAIAAAVRGAVAAGWERDGNGPTYFEISTGRLASDRQQLLRPPGDDAGGPG